MEGPSCGGRGRDNEALLWWTVDNVGGTATVIAITNWSWVAEVDGNQELVEECYELDADEALPHYQTACI